ncbi:hypothetical protein ACSNN8_28855 [Actinoplanes sp. URMC 104]
MDGHGKTSTLSVHDVAARAPLHDSITVLSVVGESCMSAGGLQPAAVVRQITLGALADATRQDLLACWHSCHSSAGAGHARVVA